MASETKYFSFQGKTSTGKRNADGSLGALTWQQNNSKLDLALEVTQETIKESHSGQRSDDFIFPTAKTLNFSLSLYGATPENFARAFHAGNVVVASGTVTDEAFPDDLVVGDYVKLDHEGVSALVLTDSTGSPVTLTLDTHYSIDSAFGGRIKILDLTGLTQPISAAYSYASSNSLALLNATPEEVYLIFDGVDTANGNAPVYMEIYRAATKPVGSMSMIHNEGVGTIEMEGTALFDATKAADPVFGGLARFVMPGA